VTDELRANLASVLRREAKMGESERTLVATFLLDLLDEVDSPRELAVECEYVAEAAAAIKTLLEQFGS